MNTFHTEPKFCLVDLMVQQSIWYNPNNHEIYINFIGKPSVYNFLFLFIFRLFWQSTLIIFLLKTYYLKNKKLKTNFNFCSKWQFQYRISKYILTLNIVIYTYLRGLLINCTIIPHHGSHNFWCRWGLIANEFLAHL